MSIGAWKNFQLVVGEKEMQERTVSVRTRDNKQQGVHSFEWVKARLVELKTKRVLNAEEVFAETAPKKPEVSKAKE